MTEATTQEQVKAWTHNSFHDGYERAQTRVQELKQQKSGPKDTRIRRRGDRFEVKVWNGHMQAAPRPNPDKKG